MIIPEAVFLISLGVVVAAPYSPKSPTAPVPIFSVPLDVRLPSFVAAREPDPVTLILLPIFIVPPLLYIPIPPPDEKLNVRLPVVPRLAVPWSIYTPVPPFFTFRTVVPVVRVVPFAT